LRSSSEASCHQRSIPFRIVVGRSRAEVHCGSTPESECRNIWRSIGFAADTAYQPRRRNSDKQNAPDRARRGAGAMIMDVTKDDTEWFKQYSDSPDFKRWLADTVFGMTYE